MYHFPVFIAKDLEEGGYYNKIIGKLVLEDKMDIEVEIDRIFGTRFNDPDGQKRWSSVFGGLMKRDMMVISDQVTMTDENQMQVWTCEGVWTLFEIMNGGAIVENNKNEKRFCCDFVPVQLSDYTFEEKVGTLDAFGYEIDEKYELLSGYSLDQKLESDALMAECIGETEVLPEFVYEKDEINQLNNRLLEAGFLARVKVGMDLEGETPKLEILLIDVSDDAKYPVIKSQEDLLKILKKEDEGK